MLKKEYYKKMEEFEKKYNVIYPENKNATYMSLLNYSDDLSKPFQRWYRYKEGFSVDLVKHLIEEYSHNKNGTILDPFSGSGSTLLAACEMGYSGVGFEVNPFSFFLSKCKLSDYSKKDIELFKDSYKNILLEAGEEKKPYTLPKLSISPNVFTEELEQYYMTIGKMIDTSCDNENVMNLLKLGWLACLESLSNYRKAGNGLKKRKYVKPRVITVNDAKEMIEKEYDCIYEDLLSKTFPSNLKLYNQSCLKMNEKVEDGSIEGIIFSPPYANCFDYTEIYKLELWFGNFIKDYADLKKLRKESLHSHLNGDLNIKVDVKSELLQLCLNELENKKLWSKKIPNMLRLYYYDMFKVIELCYKSLVRDGFCCIVVGNSSYGGIVFPADLILAEHAEKIGFKIEKIEVDRYIITSTQQYKTTKEVGKYLRESVLCLVKK